MVSDVLDTVLPLFQPGPGGKGEGEEIPKEKEKAMGMVTATPKEGRGDHAPYLTPTPAPAPAPHGEVTPPGRGETLSIGWGGEQAGRDGRLGLGLFGAVVVVAGYSGRIRIFENTGPPQRP